MKYLLTALVLLVIAEFSDAQVLVRQDKVIIQGQVVDSKTKSIMPYVHVSLYGSSVGTITNSEGQFILKIERQKAPVSISFSYIGYETKTIVLDKITPIIELNPSTLYLKEVIIKPESALEIIKKGINNIPDNYLSSSSKGTAFFRETLKSRKLNYIYLSEAVLEIRKESYRKSSNSGQVKLVKGRKKQFYDDTLKYIKYYAAPHTAHRRDFVMKRSLFLNEKNFDQYNYNIEGRTNFNNKETIIISFKPSGTSSKAKVAGLLYVDAESLAFVAAEYSSTNYGIQSAHRLEPWMNWISDTTRVYYKNLHGRWYIANIFKNSIGYDKYLQETVDLNTEYITTKIDTTNTKPIPYEDRLQFRDVFIDHIEPHDTTYWGDFNIIKENKEIKQIIDNEPDSVYNFNDPRTSNNGRSKKSLLEILKKLEYSYGCTLIAWETKVSDLTLIFENDELTNNFSNTTSIGASFNLTYPINKSISTQLFISSAFGKTKLDNFMLGMYYRKNIFKNLKSRPVYLKMGIGFSNTSLKNKVGTLKTDEKLPVGNKELKIPVNVYLRKELWSIQPFIGISVELSHRLEVFVEGHYLLNLRSDDDLYFIEDHGIFRKKSSLDFTSSDVGISSQNLPVRNNREC